MGRGRIFASLKNAIDEAGMLGIGFVAAAGNDSYDNDSSPSYPASYSSENIIAKELTLSGKYGRFPNGEVQV